MNKSLRSECISTFPLDMEIQITNIIYDIFSIIAADYNIYWLMSFADKF